MRRALRWFGYVSLGLLGLVVVVAVFGLVYQFWAEARDNRLYRPPGRLVDIGDYRLHFYCTGEAEGDQPTVLLEAFAGGSSVEWGWIQPDIATVTRVCSYDRVGFGWSDDGPAPQTPHAAAADLHLLLGAAGEEGPFLVVGHSLGGLIVRQFADEYPQDVAGMVLIDSSHLQQFDRHPEYLDEGRAMAPLLRAAAPLSYFGLMRLYVASNETYRSVRLPDRQKQEWLAQSSTIKAWNDGAASVRALPEFYAAAQLLGSLGDLPLAVISASVDTLPGWSDLQAELASLSTNSRHVVIPEATHVSLAFTEEHAHQVSGVILDMVGAVSAR